MQPDHGTETEEPARESNWTTLLLLGGLVLLVAVIAYFATRGNGEQDKLTNAEVATSTPAPSREKLCASSATYDLIKRELFRRAAQLRGSDQSTYDRLAGFAVLRMENPVMESQDTSTGAVNCSGSLSLDLPPGVAAVGGRRTLTSEVDYTVQQAADGSGPVVLLRSADAIVTPLATLGRTEQTAPQVEAPADNAISPEGSTNEAAPEAQPRPAPSQPPPQNAERPSYSCAKARTRGEAAVCSDAGLAALDRNMASEYGRAFSVATPEQRMLLRQTAQRFYAYRDRCPDRQCIASAYAGRTREIRDIIEGRWQPPN